MKYYLFILWALPLFVRPVNTGPVKCPKNITARELVSITFGLNSRKQFRIHNCDYCDVFHAPKPAKTCEECMTLDGETISFLTTMKRLSEHTSGAGGLCLALGRILHINQNSIKALLVHQKRRPFYLIVEDSCNLGYYTQGKVQCISKLIHHE